MALAARVAVVGHVEWVTFARVPHVPRPGEIVEATESWEEVGGSGAVAAVQLAKLAGEALFFTALGSDETGSRAADRLRRARRGRARRAPRRSAAAGLGASRR